MFDLKLLFTLLSFLIFGANILHGRSKQGRILHGPCAHSYLEKRTSTLEKLLRKEWLIRCLTTYVHDRSEYINDDDDIYSPRCHLAGIGDMCPAIKTTFKTEQFYLLGPNVGINQARYIYATYNFDDKEFAIFRMKYMLSWLKNQEGGEPIVLDIRGKDRELYNGFFAILYMDPGGKFALVGACPNFKVNFIMMEPLRASYVKHKDNLTDIYKDLSDTWKHNNLTNSTYQYLFGDIPSVYKDMTPPYDSKYNWRF